ncbi:MAG: chemotaxis protein CheW, partial [Planctomycetia bacterium]
MVIFRSGQEHFGLEATSLVEVASTRVVHGIPNRVGGLLEGIVNIRGELQLCVSLEKFLGIEKNQGDEIQSREKMLVLEKSGQRWVTKVDEVFAVFRIVKKGISPTPAT